MYKFQYIRPVYNSSVTKNPGVITIASNLNKDPVTGYPNRLDFAVSFCSPKDTFSKVVGRNIAVVRAESKNSDYFRSIPLQVNRKLTHFDISDLITANIFGTMKVPRWALENF
jgi:hypothetical protein